MLLPKSTNVLLPSCCTWTPATNSPILLKIEIVWPELALSMMPPFVPARLKLTAAPPITKGCAVALKVQESGATGAATITELIPVESKIADWPAATGGAPAGGFAQLVPRL